MENIAINLTNVILGLGSIGAGIGFGVEEKKKMEELNAKSEQLRSDVNSSGNLYDHIYYLVMVNLDRSKRALDKLPSDFIEKVEKQITADINDSDTVKTIKTVATILGYVGQGVAVLNSFASLSLYLRNRRAAGQEPEPDLTTDHFEDVPLGDQEPTFPVEGESSLPRTPKLQKLSNGLAIGGIVFGVAGLAATIGLGVWTLDKLEKAISDVEAKQIQVNAFKKAMTKVLDEIVEAAGLPDKDYGGLNTMAGTWKKIAENFDSYEKSMNYAIHGYFQHMPIEKIKAMVDKESDKGKPFPEDGYPLASTLAEGIRSLFQKKKTDKEVVAFFATENPKIGLRFVFDEYFISSLRWGQ